MSAIFSPCRTHRYRLERRIADSGITIAFFGVNPSTADAEVDDATIRSCVRLSKGLDYGSFEVINLFSWWATDPKDLEAAPGIARIGPEQERISSAAVERCDMPICAWGCGSGRPFGDFGRDGFGLHFVLSVVTP